MKLWIYPSIATPPYADTKRRGQNPQRGFCRSALGLAPSRIRSGTMPARPPRRFLSQYPEVLHSKSTFAEKGGEVNAKKALLVV